MEVSSDSECEFVEAQSFSFSKKRNFACVESQEDMDCEGTPVKAPASPKRRMMTPMPQQSSYSSMEEKSPWCIRERTAVAKMEQYVNKSDCIKLEIAEVEDFSLGSEYSDVDAKHIFKKCDQGRQKNL